ncbi:MAG: hypothetical protein V9G29_17605 [Burkholderiaceae bacterium]
MTQRLVDRLESIEVDQHQRQLSLVGIRLARSLRQRALEDLAVGQLGQWIAQRLLAQLALRSLQGRTQVRLDLRQHQQHRQQRSRNHLHQHGHGVFRKEVLRDHRHVRTLEPRRAHHDTLGNDDREAQDECTGGLPGQRPLPGPNANLCEEPQRRRAARARRHQRHAQAREPPGRAGLQPQCLDEAHLNGNDARGKQQGTDQRDRQAGRPPARHGQTQRADGSGAEPDAKGRSRAVFDGIGKLESLDADHLGRPQTGSQCQRRAQQPAPTREVELRLETPGQVQADECRQECQLPVQREQRLHEQFDHGVLSAPLGRHLRAQPSRSTEKVSA